ncbi:hypothetical protein ES705_46576 [subsurface metagenome]
MLPTDIDKLTDAELEQLVGSEELKCKIKDGALVCATSEDLNRAIARLKNQPKRLIFEVTPEPAAESAAEPAAEPTES